MSKVKNCYMGKILRIDLTSGNIGTQDFGSEYTDLFLGGRGVASKILYDEVPPDVDKSIDPFSSPKHRIF